MRWLTAAVLLLALGAALVWVERAADTPPRVLPAASADEPVAPAAAPPEKVVLAGGCFWGVQAVFQHVHGVLSATAGYAGGAAATAHYDDVSTGATGHAESVQIVYDPHTVTLGQLLRVFFSVAADPTELNFQGPDIGRQYRSVVFYTTPEQLQIARAYITQLAVAHAFARPIVTQLVPLPAFYPAEDYHQDYLIHHPDDLYIRINDAPKVAALQHDWPQFWTSVPAAYRDPSR